MENKKKIAKLNKEIIDMVTTGKNVEIGMIADGRFYITADGRNALLFGRGECMLDIEMLMNRYGRVMAYLPIPKEPENRANTFELLDLSI